MSKINPKAMYVVHSSATLPPNGERIVIGQRFRGDHPFVRNFPGYFVHEGRADNATSVELDALAQTAASASD